MRSIRKEVLSTKYIGCGDLHITDKCPRYRIDDYWETAQNKLKFIVETANERDAQILIAGDIFDTSRVGYNVTNKVIEILHDAHYTPVCIAGQHDLLYHTALPKCPLWTLHHARAVTVVQGTEDEVTGVSFGEDIPIEPNDILLIHKTITEKKPPFFLEDAISSKKFMRLTQQFKVIVSGDYHVPFTKTLKDQVLVNTGCMMRGKKDMRNYIPYIWEIEIGDTTKVEQIQVPHKPYDEVFDLEAMEYDEDHGITVDTEKLKELMHAGIDNDNIETIVWTLYKRLTEDGAAFNKTLIKEVLDECTDN